MIYHTWILAGLLLATLPAAAADFEQQVNADPRGTVEVTNVSGRIDVSGWSRSEVRVEARIDNHVQRIDVGSQAGRTTIKVVMPGAVFGAGGSADLKVKVPRGSRIDVSSVSAPVQVTDVDGDQHLRSVSGSLTADIAGGDTDVKTVSGDVRLRGRGRPGTLHVTTISGDLRLEHAAGEVEAGTVSGSLDVQVDPARSVRVRTTSGRVSFEGALQPGATLEAQSLSGALRVHARAADGYRYEVSSFSGRINDCFNQEPERTSEYGPGYRLNGTLRAGKSQVNLKTLSGVVDLCDH